MKVWRNSEGREFRVEMGGGVILGPNWWLSVSNETMELLGYELVEKEEPEEFEAQARQGSVFYHPRLIPGKTYVVREKR